MNRGMKHFACRLLLAAGAALFAAHTASAASYTDNTYQKLSQEYIKQAEQAKRAGDYETAIELSNKAKENAELSRQFIDMMRGRSGADEVMAQAKERMDWADENDVASRDPDAYSEAQDNYNNALAAYDEGNYDAAEEYGNRCLAALQDVKARPKLPEYYTVDTWKNAGDCFWNIAAKPFVYNNPYLWKHLYDANRDSLPEPDNPDLVLPKMKMRIPSINGEERDGVYDSELEYGTYGE